MSKDISVIGIGPGSLEYLLPVALNKVKEADVLVGGNRALELFKSLNKETFKIKGDLKAIINYINNLSPDKKVAVLVSGDPGFYSFLNYLKENYPGENIKVIPGISSIQIAFARIKSSWHDACLISLHGRRRENLGRFLEEKLREYPKVAILTDSRLTPDGVARLLLEEGFKERTSYVLTDLTMPSEKVKEIPLTELAESREKGNSVVIIGND